MSVQSLNQLSSRAIIGRYYATLETLGLSSWVTAVSQEFSSNQDSETYRFLGMTPAMRQWLNGRQAKGLRVDGTTITNLHYEATLDIPVEDIRRDKTSQIMVRVDDLARRNLTHWNSLLSTLILNGTTQTCYDGQFFFDSDHASGDSGTQVNLLTNSQVAALNVGTATAPTADEMADAILGVIAYMHSYVDDQGEPMYDDDGGQYLVLCGTPAIFSAAKQAVSKNNLDTGAGTRDNPLAGVFNVDAVYNQRFSTNTAVFYVVRTDAPIKPLIRQVETNGALTSLAEGSELEFNEGIWRFGIDSWRNVGYGYWQYATHCTLS